MVLVGQDVLKRVGRRNGPLRIWLTKWAATVENAVWHSLNDVRKAYPTADGVQLKKRVITVFNVKGNEYRLLTLVDYEIATVTVLDVVTHAEYDKNLWKDRY